MVRDSTFAGDVFEEFYLNLKKCLVFTNVVNVQELWIFSQVVSVVCQYAPDAGSNPEVGPTLNVNYRRFALISKNVPIRLPVSLSSAGS